MVFHPESGFGECIGEGIFIGTAGGAGGRSWWRLYDLDGPAEGHAILFDLFLSIDNTEAGDHWPGMEMSKQTCEVRR